MTSLLPLIYKIDPLLLPSGSPSASPSPSPSASPSPSPSASPSGSPSPSQPPLSPLNTTSLETYLLGGFGGTTQPGWEGHFNNLINNLWPNYRDLGQMPAFNGALMQYDPGRLALLGWHFLGQVRSTWDSRFIDAAEASARIWHKFYTENGVISEFLAQTTGLAMLYMTDPDLYAWCLEGLQVYYDHYDGAYLWLDPTWHQRELYCREKSYVLRALYNYFLVHPSGFGHAGHAAGQNYHWYVGEVCTYWVRQWLNEWQQSWAGGFSNAIDYGCHVGNIQNWAYWPGTLSAPGITNNLGSLNQFMLSLWFDTAEAIYLNDPDHVGAVPLLQDMIDLAEMMQTESWDPDGELMWYEIGACRQDFYQQPGHWPSDQCSPGQGFPNHGWGDSRSLTPPSLDLTAFSLNMCGFLWHVTGDSKWITYGDRNWIAFWTTLGDPLNSNQLWSPYGKQFCESVTHCFQYLKWRDYPDLFTDMDARWSPTYSGSTPWPNAIELGQVVPWDLATLTPDFHGYLPFGSYTTSRPLSELNRSIVNDAVDPNSDALLAPHIALGSKLSVAGIGSADYHGYGTPLNVVAGTTPLVPIEIYGNPQESDPGPYPIPLLTSVQNWYWVLGYGDTPPPGAEGWPNDPHILRRSQYYDGSPVSPNVWVYYRPPVWKLQSVNIDQHSAIIDRDNEMLYEIYQAWTENNGVSWKAGSAAKFNLRTGGMRPDGWTSTDAAGLPITPLLIRYDEAVLHPPIRHAINCTLAVGYVQKYCQWPARHAAANNPTGIPFGARLRLKQSWYDANKNSFSGAGRAILDCLRTYGLIISDVGLNWDLGGVQDKRWSDDNNGSVNLPNLWQIGDVPVSALEILTIVPGYTFTGPANAQVGIQTGPYTVTRIPAHDMNLNDSVQVYEAIGTPGQLLIGSIPISDAQRSGTVMYTPTSSGQKELSLYPSISWALPPAPIIVTVT